MVKKGAKGHRVLQEVLLSTPLISAEKKERKKKVLKSYSLENQSFFQMLQGNIIRS